MSDKKSGTAVLEKPSTAIPKINITGEPDKQNDPQIEERQRKVEELIHSMETRMKQASIDFKASDELQLETRELSHEIAGRIRRIGQTAKTDDAFERDVAESVAAAVRYIINKARKDTKEEKNKEEEKKEKEKEGEKKRNITPHGQEKPDVFKKNENLAENVKTKAPETVNKIPETKNESNSVQSSSINQQKLGAENPLSNKGDKAINKIPQTKKPAASNKVPSQPSKTGVAPKKGNQAINAAQKAIAHQEIVHALQRPQDERYITVKKPHDVKLHNKIVQSIESPEDELKRQMHTLSDSLKNRFIHGSQKKEEDKKKSASIIPIATLLGQGIKQKFRRSIPQTRSEEELIETTYGDEVMDRGSAAVGNPHSQNVTINRGTPKNTGEESYSQRDSGNASANKQQAAAAAQGGGGGRRNRKKRKIRERIEEKYGKKVLRELLLTVVKSPWFWLAIGIIYLVLFIISIFGGAQEDQTDGSAPSLLSITKTGPANAIVGQDLVYTITADYKGTADDLTIVDQFPEGVTYVSSTPTGVYDAAAKTVTWNAKTLGVTLASPANWSVKVTLRATLNNIKVVNKATASVVGTAGGAGYVPPTATDCGNAGYKSYMAKTPLKLNFGDPGCNFSKDELYTQLKAADPSKADIWFNKVIPCESGYNPNAYAGPQTGTPDARGAWGLYQMGSSNPAGSAPPAPGKNGPNDRGDVPWQIQTINATTYAERLSSLGQYWACARNVKYQ